jgi:probable HAF family extracellular repeat protein
MKTIHTFKIQLFLPAFVMGMGLACSFPSFAQQYSYLIDLNSREVRMLDNLDSGEMNPQAINDAGQVVGYSFTHIGENPSSGFFWRAFITGPDGIGTRDLGALGEGGQSAAKAINDAGQVAGWSNPRFSSDDHAFITGPNGVGMTDLRTLGSSGNYADAINDNGQVAGLVTGGNVRAFITDPNGSDIAVLDKGVGTWAYGINNAGQVVGTFLDNQGDHAFITGANGTGIRDLGTLGGRDSVAYDINNAGQVVGYSNTSGGTQHAFITGPDGAGMSDLAPLGGSSSVAFAINDAGEVVGGYQVAPGRFHAFVTGPDGVGMTDLNSLVSLPNDIYLDSAWGINNHGQVIATGLVPEPETYVMLLAGLGLLGFMTRHRKRLA